MQLIANFTVDPGDEITTCYDPEADFLDTFERYGFFDETSVVHTAEVVVMREALWSAAAEEGVRPDGRRRKLVANEAARLRCLAESMVVSDSEDDMSPHCRGKSHVGERRGAQKSGGGAASADGISHAEEVLKRPIEREAAARRATARLLRAHVAGYAFSVEEARRELEDGLLDPSEEAATRLILFEQELLLQQASALERQGAAPSCEDVVIVA